jgi:hypothetical protein
MSDIESIAKALAPTGPNYLGDVGVVDVLIRNFLLAVSEVDTYEAALVEGDKLALIFSGMGGDYTPIPDWHTRDELGLYIAKHYGKLDPNGTITEILRGLFYDAILRFYSAIKAGHESGDDAMKFQVDALIEELVALLTGTWEITFPQE